MQLNWKKALKKVVLFRRGHISFWSLTSKKQQTAGWRQHQLFDAKYQNKDNLHVASDKNEFLGHNNTCLLKCAYNKSFLSNWLVPSDM